METEIVTPSPPARVRRASPWPTFFLAGALFGLTALLFWPTVGYELVDLDDLLYIHQNKIVLDGFTWSSIQLAFTHIWHGMWAPGLWLSYMLDMELFGLEPWGYHLVNLLLHALNAALVFVLFRSWTGKSWRAFWAAALWAWHPLRVESVAWVAERKDVLSGLFFLLCLGAYWLAWKDGTASRRRRGLLRAASAGCLAIGLLVKPMLMTTPAVLLLLDVWPLKRLSVSEPSLFRRLPALILEKWAFWLMAAASAFLSMKAHAAAGAVMEMSWLERLKMIPLHYVFYLMKTVRPANLTALYEPLYFVRFDFLLAAFILAAITWWSWPGRRHPENELVGWAWFLGLLLPVIGLVRFGAQSVADRFTYLPAIGLSVLLLQFFSDRKHPAWKWGLTLFCCGSLLWMARATARQLPAWQDSSALYDNLLRYFPSSAFGLHFRSMQQIQHGDPVGAEATIDRVLQTNPDVELYRYGKALAMCAQDRPADAKAWLEARLPPERSSIPGYWEWHLGMLAFHAGQFDDALRYAEIALDKLPVNDTSRNDLMLLGMAAAFEKGDDAAAREWAHRWSPYRNKSRIELLDLMPYYLSQWKAGIRGPALEYFRRVLRAYPDNAECRNNIAWVLATSSWGPADPQEILQIAKEAKDLIGEEPALLDTLGVAYAHAGDFTAARECEEKAMAFTRFTGQEASDFYRNAEKRLRQYRQDQPWLEEDAAARLLQAYYGR